LPEACPACANRKLSVKGFGTEKIEDELKIYLPKARIARMDLDTVRGKNALTTLIDNFEQGKLDVLVGTQMVTKGLDFDRVGLVGILSADQLLQFPDFRSTERAFQLMTQVSGRAGRKHKRGKVLIQAFNTTHPVLAEVLAGDYEAFFQREQAERHEYAYPPFTRLIRVTLKHKKPEKVNEAGKLYDKMIRSSLGDRVRGPAVPSVGRVRTYYLLDFLIKLERNANRIIKAKELLLRAADDLRSKKGLSGVRINIDVDPF
jgi:primosomal protein N' (replication factor Y)